MNEVVISTDRLLLKGISPQVIHEVFASRDEAGVKAFFGVDDKGYQHYKDLHEKGMETYRHSLFFFLLIDKATHQPIGEGGFHTWNRAHRRAELYYLLRTDVHKRKGFMTEALAEVIRYGFAHLDLHRVEALVASWNTPSVKLLERFGFRYEGTMREDYMVDGKMEDSDCYSLLEQEWRSLHP